ncbi:MAG: substrate-binding domain-containing protein [Oscillospiraceae bacterium]|nr:substrate-binding domain-containing protein [Oscillospiraceae bacterium]
MKKTLALLLTLVLILGLLAGCGSSGSSPAPASSETPAASEPPASPAAPETPAASEAPAASESPAAPAESETPAASESPAAPSEEPEPAGVNTVILKEADDKMINTYTLLAVNPDAPFVDADGNPVSDVAVNTAGAEALIDWFLSAEGKKLAADYGQAEYGDSLFYLLDGAPVYEGEITPATDETGTIRLSTTTSVNDSGLLGALLPVFESEYGYKVEIQSAGTGKAIAAAKYGNADLILVHSKSQEETFVADGFATVLPGFESERLSFLYNYFVLCGPADDPAGVKDCASVLDAFAAIADGKYPFISRGDGSGTHTKELSLWPEALGITAEADSFADYTDWYVSANAGMGSCLVMAEQMGAYILTDKATFLTFQANNGVM